MLSTRYVIYVKKQGEAEETPLLTIYLTQEEAEAVAKYYQAKGCTTRVVAMNKLI